MTTTCIAITLGAGAPFTSDVDEASAVLERLMLLLKRRPDYNNRRSTFRGVKWYISKRERSSIVSLCRAFHHKPDVHTYEAASSFHAASSLIVRAPLAVEVSKVGGKFETLTKPAKPNRKACLAEIREEVQRVARYYQMKARFQTEVDGSLRVTLD